MHNVYCIVYSVYCIVYSVYCIVYSVYCILYSVYNMYIVYCMYVCEDVHYVKMPNGSLTKQQDYVAAVT